jgi:site-specific recombinase XerD
MTDLIPSTFHNCEDLDQTIADIAGQLAKSSKRIYLNDTKHFADWMQEQGLTPSAMTRSDMIAYRQHLAESTYAKATKQVTVRPVVKEV